jgi:cobalt-zinc-cadmium efflux system protein
MQFTPPETDINKISEDIEKLRGIKNIPHVHVWQLNEKLYFFEAHVDLEKDMPVSQFQEILDKIEVVLKEHNISHFNIQPEINRPDDKRIIVQQGH